jgi:hypothetical protein
MPNDDRSNGSGADPSANVPINCPGFLERVLTHQIMLGAYAAAVVILAAGTVLLMVAIALLCFFYPDKANAYVLFISGPVMALILLHSGTAQRIFTAINERKNDNK